VQGEAPPTAPSPLTAFAHCICTLHADAEDYEEEEEEEEEDDDDEGTNVQEADFQEDPWTQEATSQGAEAAQEQLCPPDASVQCLESHTDSVMAVAWSPDGTQLASGGCDDHAFLTRWRDGVHLRKPSGQNLLVGRASAYLATSSQDGNREISKAKCRSVAQS
jgi:hypothetical protein